jgi:glycosyltransferase involved in cell wall biosynthesis
MRIRRGTAEGRMTPPVRLSIALCTYNGAKFLNEQFASFAAQTRLPDELVICDDGSTDDTPSLVESFAARAPFPVRIEWNPVNLGVTENFKKAVGLCTGDLIALADQDDVWKSDKLARAVETICRAEKPASTMYCTRLQYVDPHLHTISLSSIPRSIGFPNAIVENVATGCSVVFGNEIRRRFLEAASVDMVMHDWWAYLIASAFGRVLYDEVPSVLYRQHDRNVAGWQPRPIKIAYRLKWLLQRLRAGRAGMDSLNQAARFIATYPEIPKEMRAMVEELIRLRESGVLSRLVYVLRPGVGRNDPIENIGFKAMVFLAWH